MILTKEQLLSDKYKRKFLNVTPLHYYAKDENGNWVTVYEVNGISRKIKENFQSPEEIVG